MGNGVIKDWIQRYFTVNNTHPFLLHFPLVMKHQDINQYEFNVRYSMGSCARPVGNGFTVALVYEYECILLIYTMSVYYHPWYST